MLFMEHLRNIDLIKSLIHLWWFWNRMDAMIKPTPPADMFGSISTNGITTKLTLDVEIPEVIFPRFISFSRHV